MSRVEPTIVCGDNSISGTGFTVSISFGEVHVSGHLIFENIKRNESNEDCIPKPIPSLQSITSVFCGENHLICLDMEGSVFTLGNNEHGKLGIGKIYSEFKYTDVPQKLDLPPIKQVACGKEFNVCVSCDGNLYAFGDNRFKQLCLEDSMGYSSTPIKSPFLEDIDFVACGSYFLICKCMNNDIFVFGGNSRGQLGVKEEIPPIPCKVEYWPENIVDIKCGISHTLVLTSNQEVYSCGNNYSGQLGRMDCIDCAKLEKIKDLSDIVRIECGHLHSICIDSYGRLYVFGYNQFGQLGLNDRFDKRKPVLHPYLSNIIDVSSGGYHTFAKTSNNEIFAFGRNTVSQFGLKTNENFVYSPIRVFEDNEDIWCSNINKSKAKSARSILPRPSNEDDNSPA